MSVKKNGRQQELTNISMNIAGVFVIVYNMASLSRIRSILASSSFFFTQWWLKEERQAVIIYLQKAILIIDNSQTIYGPL